MHAKSELGRSILRKSTLALVAITALALTLSATPSTASTVWTCHALTVVLPHGAGIGRGPTLDAAESQALKNCRANTIAKVCAVNNCRPCNDADTRCGSAIYPARPPGRILKRGYVERLP